MRSKMVIGRPDGSAIIIKAEYDKDGTKIWETRTFLDKDGKVIG